MQIDQFWRIYKVISRRDILTREVLSLDCRILMDQIGQQIRTFREWRRVEKERVKRKRQQDEEEEREAKRARHLAKPIDGDY